MNLIFKKFPLYIAIKMPSTSLYTYLWGDIKNKPILSRVCQSHGDDVTSKANIYHLFTIEINRI